MNNGFGVKPVFYFLGILFALGVLISIARMVLPVPAYASSVEQVPVISESNAATIRYMCDGGKVTTTTIAKWQANLGVWNTVRVPFNCVVLTATYVNEGYDLKLTADFLPGQNPNLPRVANTIAKVVHK